MGQVVNLGLVSWDLAQVRPFGAYAFSFNSLFLTTELEQCLRTMLYAFQGCMKIINRAGLFYSSKEFLKTLFRRKPQTQNDIFRGAHFRCNMAPAAKASGKCRTFCLNVWTFWAWLTTQKTRTPTKNKYHASRKEVSECTECDNCLWLSQDCIVLFGGLPGYPPYSLWKGILWPGRGLESSRHTESSCFTLVNCSYWNSYKFE